MRALTLCLAVALPSCGSSPASSVDITNVLAQPVTAAGTSTAVYMTIAAKCSAPDVLKEVSAKVPQKASLVISSDVNVSLVMKPVQSLKIDCGKRTLLKPMGAHILITGVEQPVQIGHRIPLTLRFRNAGDVAINAEITSMAVLENVDPLGMRKRHRHSPGIDITASHPH